MHLDPPTYTCPIHGHDLTPQVEVLLEEQEVAIFYGKRKREFAVPTSCPGTPPDAAHEQVCRGRYWK